MAARNYRRRSGAKIFKKSEQSEQQRFINWVKRCFPHVIVYCDAAGEDMTETGRQRVYALRTIRVPDIIIDYPSRGYHGARFEHKKAGTAIYKKDGVTLRKQPYTHRYKKNGKEYIKRGDHLQEQADALAALNKAGYYSRFTIGLEHLKKHFCWYIDVPYVPDPVQLQLEEVF